MRFQAKTSQVIEQSCSDQRRASRWCGLLINVQTTLRRRALPLIGLQSTKLGGTCQQSACDCYSMNTHKLQLNIAVCCYLALRRVV
jgi:hypothetical protein